MTPERWQRVLELFGEAVELPEDEREAFLADECGDDAALASEVRRMVEADARPNPLVDSPLVEGLLTNPTEQFEPSLVGRPAQALSDSKAEDILSYDWSREGSRFACSRGSITYDIVSIANAPN